MRCAGSGTRRTGAASLLRRGVPTGKRDEGAGAAPDRCRGERQAGRGRGGRASGGRRDGQGKQRKTDGTITNVVTPLAVGLDWAVDWIGCSLYKWKFCFDLCKGLHHI
ncbi:hypothetical protein BS78_05G164200 [Paspalum vaginatum]|nr:hypothetical protein BS78_05G164200 [Paspalum vaginatum]